MSRDQQNAKRLRTDLGLELLSAVALPGCTYELREIAAWCDCHYSRIAQIEQVALYKLRRRMRSRSSR